MINNEYTNHKHLTRIREREKQMAYVLCDAYVYKLNSTQWVINYV